jgi:hypothetical protein
VADSTLNAPVSKAGVWAGRIISVLVVLFLPFDSGIKILKLPAAVEGTVQAGCALSFLCAVQLPKGNP